MRAARLLVVRLDSDGDVLLAGPAVRAAAAGWRGRLTEVTVLCGPAGQQAARLLPGVRQVLVWRCPWIEAQPPAVDPTDLDALISLLRGQSFDAAIVLTSFHQSSLPTALVLRMAEIPDITAISEDYPGSLVDTRVRPPGDIPEAERALAVAEAAGCALPPGDDGRLRVHGVRPPDSTGYVVVHPGATVGARRWPAERCAATVELLSARGHRVVVTGTAAERDLTAAVAGRHGTDLGGRTPYPELAGVLAGADAVVVGNTGPAHLAAAVGTPVVSLFSPVVPAARWAPYRVPCVLLGDQSAPCRDTRARDCPVPGHPCLSSVTPDDVADAVRTLIGGGR
ncbi:glycosyltransferase family 9 protein [Labedaea rhizosphaerae]|uniref:ADP-heptose:LPS heptosyltransferase n=1 Tax=Labedaea rhizosphaerae TaxID=598644 RepID=A0A4R6SAY8_LABRH|nr:glycosyltransferase family 9 protein [Labedaea rhizosphaerae]TDP96724.1 ADP-heptose:LPS heptosyltransferase [Labedaea rhizosphaerae]